MPKLPPDFVKAPGFDSPLRSTSTFRDAVERSLLLHLDEVTWDALHRACEQAGVKPADLALQALQRHLREPEPSAIAASDPEPAQPSRRAQLLDQLYEQFIRRSWMQCVITMRALLRERRAVA